MFKLILGEYGNQGIRNDDEAGETTETNDINEDTIDESEVPNSPNPPDHEEDVMVLQPKTRKSLRVSKKPSYLNDYVCLAKLKENVYC